MAMLTLPGKIRRILDMISCQYSDSVSSVR
jgi:hypothetical protein